MRLFTLLAIYLFALQLQAQEVRTREIGLRLRGLDDFNFMYKKSLDENTFRRYRLFSAEVDLMNIEGNSVGTFNVGASIGKERRSALAQDLQFVRGPEYFTSISVVGTDDDFGIIVQPGIGYVLGFQYAISDRFYLGLETIPSVSLRLGSVAGDTILGLTAGFNSNAIALLAMYRFTR